MSSLILHHYPLSPFAQKMRSMLGYAGLPWQSAVTREMPPRPVLATLAGGYRKIPVAQIGADVFCDTRVISEEIAVLAGKPELALAACDRAVQDYVAPVDLEVFFACIVAGGTPQLRRHVWKTLSAADMLRLVRDRISLGFKAKVKAPGPGAARKRVLAHLADVEKRLRADTPFLFGDAPNHADFSTWHSLWFLRDLGGSRLLDDFPDTLAWMDRIRAFGEGKPEPVDPQHTLDIARRAEPRPIAEEHRQDLRVGNRVRITPIDYGHEPVTGILVGVTPSRWIIARDTKECGTVHVHFPQRGFEMAVAN